MILGELQNKNRHTVATKWQQEFQKAWKKSDLTAVGSLFPIRKTDKSKHHVQSPLRKCGKAIATAPGTL
jgi:hypothetical protein